jgi:hypothetical protein
MEEQKVPREELNLFNIVRGAVPEVFARELKEVLKNIADVNTAPGGKRRIVLTFDFLPYPDRSAFSVSLQCRSGLASVEAIDGIGYLVKTDGKVSAYSKDIRQQSLWDAEEKPADGKSAGAADKVVGIGG